MDMDEEKMRAILNRELAGFFGKLHARLDEFDEKKADRAQVERLQTTMDGVAGSLDIERTERTAINYQLDGQNGWIGQLAEVGGVRLVPEQ